MALMQEMEVQGNWLFRHRGVMPWLLIPLLIVAILDGSNTFLDREPVESWWLLMCALISITGILIRVLVIGYVPSTTSGRNTASQRASRVNTNGMYSIVRHPLYVGNFLMALGLAAVIKVTWFTGLFILIYWIYYERIMVAEEGYLRGKFGADYDEWAARTPAFFPAFKQWKNPDMTFSWRMVLRREYPGILVVTTGFMLLDLVEEKIMEHEDIHLSAMHAFIAGIFVVGLLRFMKKKTSLLNEPGR